MTGNGFEKRVALHRTMRLGIAPRATASGSAWIANVSGDGGGGTGAVSSVKGTTNQIVVTPTTGVGDVVVSLPNVVTTAEYISSSTTGAIAFSTGNGNFTIDGLGNIYAYGGSLNCVHTFNFDSIQTEGGIHVKHTAYGITDDGPYFSATTGVSASPPNPGSGAAGYGGLQHRYSGTWWYFDPDVDGSWNYVDFEAANSAVTSVVPGTGVTVTMNAGAATVAIGQGVWPTSSVTFAQVVTGNAGAPSDIVLQTQSGNFSLDNSGNVSSVGTATFHGGFNCTNNFAFSSIQTMGGVYAGHSIYGLTTEGPLWTGASAGPPSPDSSHTNYGALQFKEGSIWYYFNPDSGWATVDFQAAANGITAIMGTPNQIVVVPFATTATISLPDIVDTTTFNISAAGTFTANGTTVIDGAGNGFFGSVTTSNATKAPVGGVNAVSMVVGGAFSNALSLPNGGVQAQLGFYTPSVSSGAINAPAGGVSAATVLGGLSTAFNTIHSAGGIYAGSEIYGMTSDGPYFSKSSTNPGIASIPAGYGAIQHRSSSIWSIYIPGGGTTWFPFDFVAVANAAAGTITSIVPGTGVHVSVDASNNATVSIGQAVETASSVVFANVSSPGTADFTTGFHSSNTAATTVNIPNGGVYATQLVATLQAFVGPALSINPFPFIVSSNNSSFRGMSCDYYSTDALPPNLNLRKARGTAAVPAAVVNGDALGVINVSGHDGTNFVVGTSVRWVVDNAVSSGTVPTSFNVLTGVPNVNRMTISSGGLTTFGSSVQIDQAGNISASNVILAQVGVNCTGTAYNSIQTSGGVSAKSVSVNTTNSGDALTISGLGTGGLAQIRMVGGNYGVLLRNDGSTFYVMLTNSGDPYGFWKSPLPIAVDLPSGAVTIGGNLTVNGTFSGGVGSAAPVTSILAGLGVNVSNPTGAVTISIGQDVKTTSSVGFALVNVTNAVTSFATGTAMAFQTSNGNFQVFGNGALTCAGLAAALVNSTGPVTSFSTGTAVAFQVSSGAFQVLANGALTCSSLTCSGTLTASLFNASATGTALAFQAGNGEFSVLGNGALTCFGVTSHNDVTVNGSVSCSNFLESTNGFKIGTVTIIDLSGTLMNCNINTTGYITCTQPISGSSYKLGAQTIIDASGNVTCAAIAAGNITLSGVAHLTAGGGITGANFATNGYGVVIGSTGYFIGAGVNTPGQITTGAGIVSNGGIQATGYNTAAGGIGQNWTLTFSNGFGLGGNTYHNLIIQGGVVVSAS